MVTMAGAETAVCPFLNPGLARVPAPDGVRRFRIPWDFDACPVYERHASH